LGDRINTAITTTPTTTTNTKNITFAHSRMDNLSYQYLDSSFNPDKAAQYTLLLKGDGSRFSFAVAGEKKLLLLSNHLSWDVFDDPERHNLLFGSYGKRIIGLPDSGFTFIPVSVFHPEKAADFARFLDIRPDEKVCSQPLDAENQVLFKISGDMLDRIEGRFSLHDVVFAPKGWILAVGGENPSNNNIYLDISGETLEALNFHNNRLRFYNSFEFTNEDELAYFVTLVANELQIPSASVNLVISGDAELNDKNCSRLSNFFGSIEMNTAATLNIPKQTTPASVLSLTALSLCGSSAEH